MLRIIIGLAIVGLGLLIYSLIECLQTPRHRIRVLPRIAWIAVIVLLPIVGAGLWLGFGRVRDPKKGSQAPQRPSSPDDDPDFLRQVEIQRRHRQREEEKRQREADLRRKERRQQEQKAQESSEQASSSEEPETLSAEAQARAEQEKQLGEAADEAVSGGSSDPDSGTGSPHRSADERTAEDHAQDRNNNDRKNKDRKNSEDDGETGTSRPDSRSS
ncbi:PLD nuclease N-terminal domain-containing protein [Nesterenkonia sp. Act20]|uniref:PLD nuclease N-terminal domain-containing protein n=1 Tax=Nesterenkonia sp. Act20 TaxID=1483432 RepID=UPI001C47568E|nr:PLD nuclease N-terminal domain-containing protein [Nesterenkonia sp. Act20]